MNIKKVLRKIIGQQYLFAIEYQQSTFNKGFCRLWIENIPIGSFDDEVYLGTLYISLMNVRKLKTEDEVVKFTLNNNQRTLIKSEVFEKDKYAVNTMIGLPENFDDFSIRAFEYENEIFFYSILINKPHFKYGSEYTKMPKLGVIPKPSYIETIKKFESLIMNIKA